MNGLLSHLARLALMLISIAVVLIPVELWLQQRVRLHPPIAQSDLETRFSLRPHRTVRDRSPGDFSVTYATNSRGFRYPEIEVPKPEGTVRILGVGDSFTFGVGVEAEETYLARLEQRLRQTADATTAPAAIEVVNAGTSGWGTSHALAFLEARGWPLEPDAVIVGFFANDPADDLATGLYTVEEGALQHTPPGERVDYFPERAWISRLPFYDFLSQHSALMAVVRTQYMVWREAQRLSKTPRLYKTAGDEPKTTRTQVPEELTRLLFRRLREVSEARALPLAVLLIPTRWQPEDDPQTVLERFEWIRQICDQEGIPCLDATAVLLESGDRVGELYFLNDFHWRPRAHDLAAAALHRFVLDRALLEKPVSDSDAIDSHAIDSHVIDSHVIDGDLMASTSATAPADGT